MANASETCSSAWESAMVVLDSWFCELFTRVQYKEHRKRPSLRIENMAEHLSTIVNEALSLILNSKTNSKRLSSSILKLTNLETTWTNKVPQSMAGDRSHRHTSHTASDNLSSEFLSTQVKPRFLISLQKSISEQVIMKRSWSLLKRFFNKVAGRVKRWAALVGFLLLW